MACSSGRASRNPGRRAPLQLLDVVDAGRLRARAVQQLARGNPVVEGLGGVDALITLQPINGASYSSDSA